MTVTERKPMHPSHRSLARHAAFFIALLATSFALGAALAHAFELLNKIGMTREEYFIVQRIYSGWDRLGFVLAIQLVGILAVILLYLAQPRVAVPSSVGLVALVAAQVAFWVWTFPANQATGNWTRQPANWDALRACLSLLVRRQRKNRRWINEVSGWDDCDIAVA